MADRWALRIAGIGMTCLLLTSGCGSDEDDSGAPESSPGGIDAGPMDGTRQDAIDVLVSGCTAEGGSTTGCECMATFLIDNTSRDEMVFADEPPNTGEWIYFGGNLWVPGRYQSTFAACGR